MENQNPSMEEMMQELLQLRKEKLEREKADKEKEEMKKNRKPFLQWKSNDETADQLHTIIELNFSDSRRRIQLHEKNCERFEKVIAHCSITIQSLENAKKEPVTIVSFIGDHQAGKSTLIKKLLSSFQSSLSKSKIIMT